MFLELVQNDGNNKIFKILPGLVPMPWGFFSNDDLYHFYDRVKFVPDASVWVTAYNSAYPQHSCERYRKNCPLVFRI